jgi:hypothetical protein
MGYSNTQHKIILMQDIFNYIGAAIILILVIIIFYKVITSRPSDKYYNDSWKNRDNNY